MANNSKKTKKVVEAKVEPIEVESPLKTGMSDLTKGVFIGSLVTALIATLVILLILGKNDGTTNKPGDVDLSQYSEAMQEFYEYYESDEKTLIVFASSQCGYCVAQKPIVEAIAKEYNLNYLYMDYLTLGSNEEIDLVVEALGVGGSTPTSVVVQDGKVIYSWVGYVDGKTYVENLVKAGMLKKGTKYDLEDNIKSINYDKFKKLLKDDEVSAVLIDMPTCGLCYQERVALNALAEKYDVDIYNLSSDVLSEDEMEKFLKGLGDWGFTTKEYKENYKNVEVPLLLFVKDGKIKKFEVGYVEGKTDLKQLFESVGLID